MITTPLSISAKCIASWGNHGLFANSSEEHFPADYLRRIGRPLCGDNIEATQNDKGQWHITRIAPQTNTFARADRRGRKQVIAANIDQLLIVVASEPAPSKDLLDRYLVAGELTLCQCIIIHNKVDLDAEKPSSLSVRLQALADIGYPVISVSATKAIGIDMLNNILKGNCSMLVGQSGVGKSSLVNQLIPNLDLQTKAISNATGKGTHTTSISTLYHLPNNGQIIDSPGVWEYGLWQMPADELAWGFKEFRDYLGQCRFRDCQHLNEPGCKLRENVADSQRYACYQRLLNEQKRFV